MSRIETQKIKVITITDLWFAMFFITVSVVISITCCAYFVAISGNNTWQNYYELPFKYRFWFIAAIILDIVSIITFIVLLISLLSGFFTNKCFKKYIDYRYLVNGKRVSEKEYKKEKAKYNKLLESFKESLKPKKEI